MTDTCKLSMKTWAAAILAVIIIGMLTAVAYTNTNDALKSTAQLGMKSVVGVMATQINASDISGFEPGDETSPRYIAAVNKLRTLRSMDDNILNAYILKIGPDRTVRFVVDDLSVSDPQGSAKIGEVSTSPDTLEIFGALSAPTVSREPYTTKYGSFVSAYAPIDDSSVGSFGNTTAVLAIDISAEDYISQTAIGSWIIATGVVSMILVVGAIAVYGRRRDEDGKKQE